MMVDGVEADDLISLAVQDPTYKGWHKIIVSSDKDFYQLCDDETVVHRPIQKQVKNKPRIIEEFGIHPRNFALARAIAGDKSDNLPGVGGVGLATIAKRIPFLIEDRDVTVSEVVGFCEGVENQLKVHTAITENEELIKMNYSIMQLYSPLMSVQDRNKIRYALENFQFMFNKTEVEKMMIIDGFGAGNWSELYSTFRRICVDN
jgi:5'-3' exonuclease